MQRETERNGERVKSGGGHHFSYNVKYFAS